jgi:hypothetical protein
MRRVHNFISSGVARKQHFELRGTRLCSNGGKKLECGINDLEAFQDKTLFHAHRILCDDNKLGN